MGRHKKQYTEEELLEKERKKYQYTIDSSTEKGTINKCKHNRITYDAIKYDVGTMDRISLRTMYISCTISILWETNEAMFRQLRDDVNDVINEWLSNQDTWDSKNKIYVFEIPENNRAYTGSFRNVKFELHVRLNTKPVSFKYNLQSLTPLVDTITDEIKKSCERTGLVLAHRPTTNTKGMSLKEYVEKLTNTATSETSEEHAGGSCAVEV